jgi:hypothetical protein
MSAAQAVFIRERAEKSRGVERKRGLLTMTPNKVLRLCAVESLRGLGGCASVSEVCDAVESKLGSDFLDGDVETDSEGRIMWRKRVQMLGHGLRKGGVLRKDGRWGVWELAAEKKGGG